jgi:hypothetical protein
MSWLHPILASGGHDELRAPVEILDRVAKNGVDARDHVDNLPLFSATMCAATTPPQVLDATAC